MKLDVTKVVYQIREDTGHYFDRFYGVYKTKAKAISDIRKMKRKHPDHTYFLEKWDPKYKGGNWVNGGFKL
jgi:hypothetical protein